MNAYSPLFLAPTVLITCECGDVFAGYESGEVIKLHDAEYGEAGVSLGAILFMYREDPECAGCFRPLEFSELTR
ncbi:hypothetical protein [Streptomyces antibioticus]|uniref:hypothetical protein n=1 Tax=Streptomyces antibioticus TaxID=1890 RepID=UPI003F47ACB8